MEIPYPPEYFELQVCFARRVSSLISAPFEDALLHWTSFYKLLGASGEFDPADAVWRGLLARLRDDASLDEQTTAIHDYYLQRYPDIPSFADQPHWGCFAYEWRPEARSVRLHFGNMDSSEPGPLSRQRIEVRKAELRSMMSDAHRTHPAAEWVIGGSWLYSLEAYRRLFPASFGQSATLDEPHIQFRALWGQFLRSDFSIESGRAALLLASINTLTDIQKYADCFPVQVMLTRAPMREFLNFYQSM
ncbi:MAG TPA: hypothetical protein VF792_07170 [Ktedonobacterales bacterium]